MRVSKALWLPAIWLSINGSRSVATWLGMGAPAEIPGQIPATSLFDQVVAGTLILLGAIVLIRGRRERQGSAQSQLAYSLYFSYSLFSLLWSDFPEWGLKRWVRGLGDLVMVLIIVTDSQPNSSPKSLLSRVGFVLLPVGPFNQVLPGVARIGTNRERSIQWGGDQQEYARRPGFRPSAGSLVAGTQSPPRKEAPNRSRRLLAQCTLLVFGIELLFTAHSATAGGCFVFGAGC